MARQRVPLNEQRINVSTSISLDHARRLDAIADEEMTTRSHVVRRAIAFYLSNSTQSADTQELEEAA